ncbi:MAG: UDP-N-acetylmuramoyl-tripeptide--D-alanyl-D-alanine ligase [Pseudomonadota bacterium]
MSALWTSTEIATATGGTEARAFEATGLSIDTRTLKPGDLFVPLKDVRDGHDFIGAAMAAGAAGTLTERDGDGPAVKVADTMQALRDMGRAGRDRSAARRIAVTGSVGKTSVKDALYVMLGAFGPTHKSIRSFNNHFGVPITLATLPRNAEFAVFETGMNHAGELTDLSHQVAPHIALITTVAGAHRENFDSIEGIADAKAEIRHGLVEGGVLILNADNEYTPRIEAQAEGLHRMTFGRAAGADVRIVSSEHRADGGTVRLDVGGQAVTVALNVAGEHWDHNAAACIAVAHALGLDLAKAARALADVSASEGRGNVATLDLDGRRVLLIDEGYNANPTSMRAAFSAASLQTGRKLAVLGDMKELGADELALHAALAAPLTEAGFARVFTVGECMRALRGALPRGLRAPHADTVELIEDAVREELRYGDVLLLKGSNSMGLGRLARRLTDRPGGED